MNILWQEKLRELDELDKEQSWYIVKHNSDIEKLCYYVSFLEEFQKDENIRKQYNLQDYIKKRIDELNSEKNWNITSNYRTLMVASYFGLILKTAQKGDRYDNAPITETFQEIKNRCKGKFEDTELYNDIVQRQIEKIFITSPIDNEYSGRRKEFKLFPVIYLYKILLELGNATGKYSISMLVYNTLILTSHKYQDFLETLLLIKLLDSEKDALEKLEEIGPKFSKDSRWNLTLKLLDTLEITDSSITLKTECISTVAKKVYLFETNKFDVDENNYLQFLGSTKSLVNLEENSKKNTVDVTSPHTPPQQIIFYGVPGCGKSHKIKESLESELKISNIENQFVRTVFHPEYTNADFVGQILPDVKDGQVQYKFTPGPFSIILKKALLDSNNNYALIIEEINRGNAAAIFGELFQLLDRLEKNKSDSIGGNTYTNGWSEYFVMNSFINEFVRDALTADEKAKKSIDLFDKSIHFSSNTGIRLPPNLSIFATMNTSDQNVFKLDNAFKRRWDLVLIQNEFGKSFDETNQRDAKVEKFGFTWGEFIKAVNKIITEESERESFSDKQLGCWFAKAENGKISADIFADKVLEYLWDDVFNFDDEEKLFNSKHKNFSSVVEVVKNGNGDLTNEIFFNGFDEKIKEARAEIKAEDENQNSENKDATSALSPENQVEN